MGKYFLIALVLLLSGMLGFIFSWQTHHDFKPTEETKRMETFHYPMTFVKQLEHDPEAGKKIFNQYCTSCHGVHPIIEINAPRIDDVTAWKIRKKLGMKKLLKETSTGVGAMPARGGCFECSDKELKQAIQYMLDQ